MEFINIGPVCIRGKWEGHGCVWEGCKGGVGGSKSLNLIKNKKTQIVEFRVAMICTCTHKEPIFH